MHSEQWRKGFVSKVSWRHADFLELYPTLRQARLDAPGVLQHIMIREIEHRKIFMNDKDREDTLDGLSKYASSQIRLQLLILPLPITHAMTCSFKAQRSLRLLLWFLFDETGEKQSTQALTGRVGAKHPFLLSLMTFLFDMGLYGLGRRIWQWLWRYGLCVESRWVNTRQKCHRRIRPNGHR